MKKCILIDGSGLIYRGFYAIPPFLKSQGGVLTNAVFGFATILLGLMSSQKPDYIAVAFDKKGPTFRHKEFAEYKATRVAAPQELYDQIPLVKNLVETFGVPSFEVEGFEADDILATIATKLAQQKGVEIFIATGDFDLFQMASKNVAILYPAKGFKGAEIMRVADIKEKYGVFPEQIPDYKGIAGDSSDNIPGVRGIGEKGAKELLVRFKTLENIYQNLSHLSPVMRKKLEESKESAFLSKHLASLNNHMPLDFDLDQCRVQYFDVGEIKKLFEKLGFKTLQKRLDELYPTQKMQGALF